MPDTLTGLRSLGRAALDLVYPPRCAVCGQGGSFLCDACAASMPRAEGARCDVCWLPLRGRECYACSERTLPLLRLRSAFRYEGDVRRLVHAFKFGRQSCLAPALGARLIECYEAHALDADVIVPVPLTGVRRRTRGFNQALLLSRELARPYGLPVSDALRRAGHSLPQAGSASAEQRRRNVEGAFSVARAGDVVGRRVLLVDDVATTCATLSACAVQLLTAGAGAVLALTVARED